MTPRIEKLDTRTASETELRAFYHHWLDYDRVFVPEDPPVPFEWYLADWRHINDVWQKHTWILTDGAQVLGSSGAWVDTMQNVGNAEAWVYVHSDHRRQGYGRQLATALFDWLTETGHIRTSFRIPEGSEFAAVVESAGAKAALRMRRSRLMMKDVDRGLMETWIERAAERAGDYQVLYLPTPIPDEHLEAFAKVQDVMNEAPMEDYIHEDEHTTPDLWRTIENELASRQDQLLSLVAVHKPTGDFAGFTNLNYQTLNPAQAWVWNTGIDPDHRNNGLGRWIKALMMIRALDDYPTIERLDTYNAGSNEAILNINVAMGFKPLVVQVNWQGETATMRDRLGV